MTRIEELTAIPTTPQQALSALRSVARFKEWVAPDITFTPDRTSSTLVPGDTFRIEALGGIRFDYTVEAVSDRDFVLSFKGPWRGRERWSFVADGADTIVRRVYEVEDDSPLADLAWHTLGRGLVSAHYKLELSRFRAMLEREPGAKGEIGQTAGHRAFPIDDG